MFVFLMPNNSLKYSNNSVLASLSFAGAATLIPTPSSSIALF